MAVKSLLAGLFSTLLLAGVSTYTMFFATSDSVFLILLVAGTFGAAFVGGLISRASLGARIGIGLVACIFGLIVTAIGVERQRLDIDPFMLYLIFYNPLAVLGSGLSRGVEILWERRRAAHPGVGERPFQAVAAGLVVMTVYLAAVRAMSLTLNLPLTVIVLVGYVFAFAAGFLSGSLHGGKASGRVLVAVVGVLVPFIFFAALPPSPAAPGLEAIPGLAVYGVVAGFGALASTKRRTATALV